MIARCARCQETFTTERFGVQRCPHCGAEIHLADPAAPPPPPPAAGMDAPPAGAAGPGQPPAGGPPPPAGWAAPPPGAWGPPPPAQGGWGPPQPPLAAPPPPGAWGPLPPGGLPPPAAPEGEPAPFVHRRLQGWPSTAWQTLKLVALEPARFFQHVRITDTGAAVLLGVLLSTIGTWVSLAFGWLTVTATLATLEPFLRQLGAQGVDPGVLNLLLKSFGAATFGLEALLAPLGNLIAIYLLAAIFHGALLVLRAAPRGFDATLTAVAFAYGLNVLKVLPMCGGLVALVWFGVVAVLGIAQTQRSPTWKAGLAVFSPVLLACLCGCLAGLAIPAFLKGALHPGPTSL